MAAELSLPGAVELSLAVAVELPFAEAVELPLDVAPELSLAVAAELSLVETPELPLAEDAGLSLVAVELPLLKDLVADTSPSVPDVLGKISVAVESLVLSVTVSLGRDIVKEISLAVSEENLGPGGDSDVGDMGKMVGTELRGDC